MKPSPLYLALICIALFGCRSEGARSTPQATLATITSALNNGDSATFYSSLSETYRANFGRNNALSRTMDTLRGARIATQVLSVDTSGPVARVVFAAHIHGPKVNADADSVVMQFYKEGEEWKSGALMSINGHEWMPNRN